ncbi:MAG: oxidoreductase [Actinobacteria bacterium]|nr:oxidoreductase [Actinomycetota bacterium]
MTAGLPKLAVHKFASCDGCQLSLLDCEDALLDVVGAIQIANFPEASREVLDGPYDLTLIEGAVSAPGDIERLQEIRAESKFLVSIGACATAGGIQALRNTRDVDEFTRYVYASPEYIDTLDKATAVADHVKVDLELRGCPISKHQLIETVIAFLNGRAPIIPTYSVCMECKRNGNTCVMVAHGVGCLGPVTQAGCGAICPSFHRGCYGCFGPMESPNTAALGERWLELGIDREVIRDQYHFFNSWADAFREAGEAYAASE